MKARSIAQGPENPIEMHAVIVVDWILIHTVQHLHVIGLSVPTSARRILLKHSIGYIINYIPPKHNDVTSEWKVVLNTWRFDC